MIDGIVIYTGDLYSIFPEIGKPDFIEKQNEVQGIQIQSKSEKLIEQHFEVAPNEIKATLAKIQFIFI